MDGGRTRSGGALMAEGTQPPRTSSDPPRDTECDYCGEPVPDTAERIDGWYCCPKCMERGSRWRQAVRNVG